MTDGRGFFLLALVCAVLLDLLVMWIVRKRYAARYQVIKGNLLERYPFLSRLAGYLSSTFQKIFKTRHLDARQWIVAPSITLLLIGSGLALICVGQIQRKDWNNQNPTSLIVLGLGLLLLTRGFIKLGLGRESMTIPNEAASSTLPRRWVPPDLALLGTGVLLAVIGLAIGLQNIDLRALSAGWLIMGLSSISAGAWSLRKGLPGWFARFFASLEKTFELTPDRAIFLLAGISLAMFAGSSAGSQPLMPYPLISISAWVGGIVLSILGAWRPTRLPRIPWQPVAIGLGLALLSLPLRTIGAASLPLGLTGDEGSAGLQALQILKGFFNNIFITGWYSFPSLYFFIQAGFIALFGQTAEALRYSSAFAGAIEVTVTYWVARAIFDRRTALLAGLFLVFFHLHINFSRIGLNNIWDALFFTWVLGAFWLGWERRSRGLFALSGLGLGLGLYFYVTTRLLFFLLPAMALIFAWVKHRRLRDQLPHLILTYWVALTAALPLMIHFIRFPYEFMAPFARVQPAGLTDLNSLADALIKGIQAYTDWPTNVLYTPGSPLLQTIPAILLWVSVVLFLLRWRDTRFWLLAGWLASLSLVGALSSYPPGGHRYIAAAPALAIIVGLGFSTLVTLLNTIFTGPKWISVVLAAGLMVTISAQEIRLFYRYDSSVYFGGYNNMIAQSLVEILRQEPPGTLVYFMGGQEMGYQSIPSLPYLAPHVNGINLPVRWSPALAGPPGTNWNGLLVYLPRRADEIEPVQAAYPQGQLSKVYAPDGQLIFYLFDPCPPYSYPAKMVLPATSLGLPYSFMRP